MYVEREPLQVLSDFLLNLLIWLWLAYLGERGMDWLPHNCNQLVPQRENLVEDSLYNTPGRTRTIIYRLGGDCSIL